MAEALTIKAEKREGDGSAEARRLRNKGVVPAVINVESGDALSIKFDEHDLRMFLRDLAGESRIVTVDVDGDKAYQALIKDVQKGPVYGELMHADFLEVGEEKVVRVPVAIQLHGDSPGVAAGGVLTQMIRQVEIECKAKDLVQHVDLDLSGLGIDELLFVRDIKLPEGVSMVTAGGVVVVSVATSRVMRKAAMDAKKGAAGEDAEAADAGGDAAEGDSAGEG